MLNNCIDCIVNLPEEKEWKVEIKEYVKTRTIDQNARYWAMIKQATKVKNLNKDVIHEFFKALILGVRSENVDGKEIYITGSTTELSTTAHHDYVEECIAYATTEWGLVFDE